jgi:hypothetical protein
LNPFSVVAVEKKTTFPAQRELEGAGMQIAAYKSPFAVKSRFFVAEVGGLRPNLLQPRIQKTDY